MIDVAIAGVGLVTGARDAMPLPWPLRASVASRHYRPALGVAELPGPARIAAMIRRALAACGGDGPIVTGSCNGAVATWSDADWAASFATLRGPVASAACASGIHALYLARSLIDAGAAEVRVLVVDIATPPAHGNFEALRVLSDGPAPFTPDASGFQLGEAAVALRIVRAELAPDAPRLHGPVLGHDLDGDDGLVRVLAGLAAAPSVVIGQGAGPVEGDRAELAAIAGRVPLAIPIATALGTFGHTLGASSLLSVALAALATRGDLAPRVFGTALDGRPLAALDAQPIATSPGTAHDTQPIAASPGTALGSTPRGTLVACRALGGACGACVITRDASEATVVEPRPTWGPAAPPPPLRDPVLRRIAAEAHAHRPAVPPDLLIVTLDAPLPPAARIGARILPTSVLEMTPGFVPQLIARAWGFRGAATCLVGGDPEPLIAACRASRQVFRVAIRGMEQRDVEWNA